MEDQLPRQDNELSERVKELNCLYGVERMAAARDGDLDAALQGMIELVPAGWQYADVAQARVRIRDKEYVTPGFEETEWCQECPVVAEGSHVGRLTVCYQEARPEHDEGPFLHEERELLNTIAQRMAEVVERHDAAARLAHYQEDLRNLGAALSITEQRERRKLAQDLHDNIGQMLALVNMKLGAALKAEDRSDSKKAVKEARGLLSEVITSVRTLTFDLCPPVLYELGFSAAAEWLAEQTAGRYGLEVSFESGSGGDGGGDGGGDDGGGDGVLREELKVFLFQALRELLNNVGQHARAKNVQVSVNCAPQRVLVTVRDDGVGFDPQSHLPHHGSLVGFGLFSIRERIRYLGGDMKIESSPGRGTTVTLWAPVTSADAGGRPSAGTGGRRAY